MRADSLTWFGRAVAAIFVIGVIALFVAVIQMIRGSEGIAPFPIYLGLFGIMVLILIAAMTLSLVSIAVSLRRGVVVGAQQPVESPAAPAVDELEEEAELPQRPFQGPPLRATRRAGPTLVARR